MTVRLEACTIAGAVTVVASANRTVVVSPGAANESSRGMTEVTIQGSCNVRGIDLGVHADRRPAVVTGRAIVHDARMGKARRDEVASVVTDAAILTGAQMICRLWCGKTSVMTRRAIVHDADMIKDCRQESGGLVAIDAITTGWHMVAGLACGRNTVMARCTVVDDALVIKVGAGKGPGGMAHRAVFRGRNMGRIDLGIFTGSIDPVVARLTVIGDPGMIEYCRHKAAARHVTDSAIFAGHNMVRLGILAGGIDSVVARIASATQHFRARMVDKRVSETGRVVAKGAIAGGVLMHRGTGLTQGAETNETGAAIMAGPTIVGDTRVVETRRDEHGRRMAKSTILARRQMVCAFNEIRIRREKLTHMATFTAPRNIQMQSDKERCRCKRTGRVMADTAVILRRDMIDIFRRCDTGVMTGRASVGVYTQVIETYASEARVVVDDVARRTIQRCRQMIRRLA
jgi:hypothetical protein